MTRAQLRAHVTRDTDTEHGTRLPGSGEDHKGLTPPTSDRDHGGVPGPGEGYRAMARCTPVARAGAQQQEEQEQQDTDPAQGLGTADDSRTASHARRARRGHGTRDTTSRFGGGP